MKTIITALKSRTVWTIVFMVVTNIVSLLSGILSQEALTLINTVLGALAVYFKLNPTQKY
jgi:hypothetical protein